MGNKPMIVAHRGASALVKFENTLPAFEKAIEIGAPMMEFDVRKTKDNYLISFHDDNLDNIKLMDLNYSELLDMSQRKGFVVPLVEDILKLAKGKILLDIELKEEGYEEEIVSLVKKHLTYSEYIMKSFNDSTVATIKKIDPNIKTGLLLGKDNPQKAFLTRLSELFPEYRVLKTKADFVSPNYRLLKLSFCLRMRLMDKAIFVWTVNDKALMDKLLKYDIHGLITDRPDLALNILNSSEQDGPAKSVASF